MLVYVDYDSTLNNMAYSWIEWLNAEYGRNYTHEDVTHWNWYDELDVNAFKFFWNGLSFNLITPLPESQDFFSHLREEYETIILTSSSERMKKHKDRHIAEYYGEANVIHHTEKWEYACHPERKCILIDDRPLNCIRWVESGGVAFLFNHDGNYKYSETDFEHENLIKVTDYETIKLHLKGLK